MLSLLRRVSPSGSPSMYGPGHAALLGGIALASSLPAGAVEAPTLPRLMRDQHQGHHQSPGVLLNDVDVQSFMQTVAVVLLVAASILVMQPKQRSKPTDRPWVATLGLQTPLQWFLFQGYVLLSTTHMFLQARSGGSGYSPVAATVLVYFGKALVALVMHIRREGFTCASLWQPSGGRFGRLPIIVCTAVPGACFAAYDMMSFLTLTSLDPVTYQVVVHCRILLIALFWQIAFRKPLSGTQGFALLLFVAASFGKCTDKLQTVHLASVRTGLLILLGQIVVSAFNTVCSEVLLKEVAISTDLINFATYTQGFLALLLGTCCSPSLGGPTAALQTVFGGEAWRKLAQDPWMISSILCLVCFGIFTAYFLRELSSVLKELTGCCVMLLTAVVEWALLGASSCSRSSLLSMLLALAALAAYNLDPIRSPVSSPQAAEAPEKAPILDKTKPSS